MLGYLYNLNKLQKQVNFVLANLDSENIFLATNLKI